VAACCLAGKASGPAATDPDAAVKEMIRRVVTAAEATSSVVIERSDPFGGPPDRQSGRLWYLPGKGLRYKSDGKGRQDVVLDRVKGAFLLYVPSEHTVYRAPFDRGPRRLQRLITEPERALNSSPHAVAERRRVGGASVAGYRLRSASLGDSLPESAVWIAADPRSGLPRWLFVDTDDDTVLIELRGLGVRESAKLADLNIGAPKGTREEPLDPRELLERGSKGESR
jgi:hypothetical protein